MAQNNTPIEIYFVDAFTKTIGQGNRAGVVFDADNLSESQMQAIAAFANVSETAFILSSTDTQSHDIHVRYFTPTKEVPICGHATIATHYLRAQKLGITNTTVKAKTGAGVLPVTIQTQENDITVAMTQGTPQLGHIFTPQQTDTLLAALGISTDNLFPNLPIQIASTGHSKVMIPIKDNAVLHAITPNLKTLSAISAEVGSNGFFVFTIAPDDAPYKTHGRMFAPAIGINEDPVTGNANGPAAYYLYHYGILKKQPHMSYHAIQGEKINKTGVLEVQLTQKNDTLPQIKILGTAILSHCVNHIL